MDSGLSEENQRLLRRLTLNDETALNDVMCDRGVGGATLLDDRTRSLVRLAGLVARSAELASLQVALDAAWAAGARDEEIVDAVVAVAPIVGSAKIASVIPHLAIALDVG